MLVRRLEALEPDRVVSTENWVSRRLLLRRDAMGFSLHDTIIRAGTTTRMCYANHLEAVYCIEGEGTVTVEATGAVHEVRPGTVYALDQHDEHTLRASSDMRMVCVFNPPVSGREVHDEAGVYPLIED